MRATTAASFGETLPACRLRIEIAFPSCCLRAVSPKMSDFSDFRSDYPPVPIVIDRGDPGFYETFVSRRRNLAPRRWPRTSTDAAFVGFGLDKRRDLSVEVRLSRLRESRREGLCS